MKKFLALSFVMISLFFYSENTRAGSIVEPYAGALLNSSYDFNDGAAEGDVSGTAVGVRLGFSQMGFMAGLDGRRIFGTLEPDTGTDTDYTFSQLGFFVGYEAPVMVRFWGEYIFSLDGQQDDDTDIKLKKGTGFLLGVGYSFIPFVSVNLEMTNATTTEYDNGTVTSEIDTTYQTYLVSISLPLHL